MPAPSRKDNAPEILSSIRRVVINMLSLDCTQPSFTKKKAQQATEAEIRELGRGHYAQHLGNSAVMTCECKDPVSRTETRLICRRMGDSMVIFDSESWESHLLPPAATVIADIISELSEDGAPVPLIVLKQVLMDEYQLDSDTSSNGDFFGMLREIGMLSE
jgi:PqqD family protein of HPr-rel-A system